MLRYLHSVIPASIKNRFAEGTDLRKIVANMGWLTFERLLKLSFGFFITILIARHLGPHNFGILSYAISITAFLGTFVYLGLSGIVVRDLVEHPDEAGVIMGSSFALKMFGACVCVGLVLALGFLGQSSTEETKVLLIIGASLIVRPMDIIDIWFQSQTKSKYAVLARVITLVLASIGMLILLLKGAPLTAFAVLILSEFVLTAIVLIVVYQSSGQTIRSWVVRTSRMISLLKESWILIVSGVLALVYLQIDQIMLRWILDPNEVGVYSVAVKVSTVWYFIPSAICVSILPKLTKLKMTDKPRYHASLQQGFDLLFVLPVTIAIVMTFISGPVIRGVFGSEYEQAGGILAIHIWAGVFIFMRALFSKWIILESAQVFSLITHGLGAVVNVALNLLLIKHYGGYGAAVATLISYAIASYFALLLASRTRPIAWMMSKSFVFPVRMLLAWKRKSTGLKT